MASRLGGILVAFALVAVGNAQVIPPSPMKVLFIGDQGLHRPVDFEAILAPALARSGIELTYSENLGVLSRAGLAPYHALFLYNNLVNLTPAALEEVIAFVEGGKGLVVVHSGIVMARGQVRADSLLGGRFISHGTDTFQAEIIAPAHPAMKAVSAFQSWDETYEMSTTNSDRTVLMVRRPKDKPVEPWTWVRAQGRGRVYYTASGHDIRTWSVPEFQSQLAIALLWSGQWEATGNVVISRHPAKKMPSGNFFAKGLQAIYWQSFTSNELVLGRRLPEFRSVDGK